MVNMLNVLKNTVQFQFFCQQQNAKIYISEFQFENFQVKMGPGNQLTCILTRYSHVGGIILFVFII